MISAKQNPRLLVVDDEYSIRRILHASLSGQYQILEAASGEQALEETRAGQPDVILLDLGLPDIDGMEVTRRLREWTQIPIIVISVRDREADKVSALDLGADDYLTKPFNIGELMARLRAVLRHAAPRECKPFYKYEGLTVNLTRRMVKVRGQTVDLTPLEFDLLRVLVRNSGRALTHQRLLDAVWDQKTQADLHLLRVNISHLRKKIEVDPTCPRLILTEPGVGYRLASE